MYDARVDGTTSVPNAYPTWDLHVENGIVPLISDVNEEQQRANVAVFLQLGTVPSLLEVGIDWTGFFTKNVSFGDLDTMIRKALLDSDSTDFEPSYEIVDDNFYVVLKRTTT